MRLIILSLLLISCASEDVVVETHYDTQELKELVLEYEQRAKQAGIPVYKNELVAVRLSKLPDGLSDKAAGVCYENEILLLPGVWDSLPECDKKLLLFHELGHCLSHKEHTENGLMSYRFFIGNANNCEVVDEFFE